MHILLSLIIAASITTAPHHYCVSVLYPDGAYTFHSVTELRVDSEIGDIIIKYDKPDEMGNFGIDLELENATIVMQEDNSNGEEQDTTTPTKAA